MKHYCIALVFISLICITHLMAPAAFAKKPGKVMRTVQVELDSEGNGPLQLQVGLGLEASGTKNGLGINLAAFFKPSASELYLGLETGFDILGSVAITVTTSTGARLSIPILASGYYVFGDGDIRPYVGMAIGLWLNVSNTGTGLAMFLKPGIIKPLSDSVDLLVEGRFGGVDGTFVMYPRVALAIKF